MSNLINSTADIKAHFATIDGNMLWTSFKSFCEDAERDVVQEAIGADALTYFTGNLTGLTGVKQDVLTLLQRASAYLTVFNWSQTSLFRITDKALYIGKSGDGVIISDKKLRDFKRYCDETGNNHLDAAIDLMENNLDQFPAYAESGTRQNIQQGFIRTAKDFQKQKSIRNSRVTFLAMYTTMVDVQENRFPAVMGDYYEIFKERFLDDELSPDEKKLLPVIKKALAFLTIAESGDLPLQITGEGIFISRLNGSLDYEQKDPVDMAQLQYTLDDLRDKGNRKILELQQYLIKNAILYPDFTPPPVDDIDVNSLDSGIYVF